MTELTIVIPSYNFRASTEFFVQDCLKKFPHAEIIVVIDEGRNSEFWKKFSGSIKCISVPHVGKGFAVGKGFSLASGKFVGFMDDDGSVSAGEFKRMLEFLENSDYDGVIASRKTTGSDVIVRQPLFRKVLGIIFTKIINIIFGLEYKDTQCGAKIFRREVVEGILPLKMTGFSFDLEILIKCRKRGFKIREFGVKWIDDKNSTLGLRRILRMVYDIFLMKLIFK